ncbi:MAG: sensor histidine kinase [Bacteroidaceae bacterium]|nr:sensor histidine kinase [Bacteroidaceae bacterium]
MRKNIRQSLSTRLCLDILLVVVLVFSLSLGFLYWQSRSIIRDEAIDEASHVLDNTALRVKGYMVEVETATRNIIWLVNLHNEKDSLLKYTHRIVANHPNTNGCSITMEPDFYPDEEYGFSAYSVRLEDYSRSGRDSVVTVREADYDYYNKVWYKTPRQKKTACWVDPFDDYNDGTLSSPEMIASYCVPLNDRQGKFVGVISTDLSLRRLTETITAEHPYENSYFMLLGADGHYFVHPDTTKLLKQTIFTDMDPREHTDIVALGYEMTNGRAGHMDVKIDGKSHIVLYRPLEGTQWSVALVCPSNELLRGYNSLNYILVPMLIIGLLLLAIGCHRIVKHFTQPLGLLAAELRQIGHGDYETLLPHSQRTDLIGQLQNSFCQMRQSISKHIHDAEKTKEETEQRTKELEQATLLARRASEQKTQFMQDITHQIHTPLNIVHGFSQILCETDMLSDDEKKEMAETMYVQTNALDYMVNKLFTASLVESRQTIVIDEAVGCNMLAHEAVETASSLVPHTVEMHLDSHVGDELTLQTNRHHLLIVLTELLVNALHFTSQGTITMRIEATDDVVNFIVEDTGPGIPLDKGDFIFEKFTKVDMFTEGLGLGLFLCRRVVMLMGGTLTLDPQYTGGSRFVVSLPLHN